MAFSDGRWLLLRFGLGALGCSRPPPGYPICPKVVFVAATRQSLLCMRMNVGSVWYPSSVSMYHAYLGPNMVEGQNELRKLLPERI
jgi:hypothetical protein